MFPPPFTSCGVTFLLSPTPLPPGITETVLLAPHVAHEHVHIYTCTYVCHVGGGRGAVPRMTSGARKGGRVVIATRMLWVFGEQRHLMLIFHPVQADNVVVTGSGSNLKKPPLVLALLKLGQCLSRNLPMG